MATLTATIPITVNAVQKNYRLIIDSPPTKTVYNDGEKLNTSGAAIFLEKYTEKDGVIERTNVTSGCAFSPANNATLNTSNTSVTVTYVGAGNIGTLTASFNITVKSAIDNIVDNGIVGQTVSITLTNGQTTSWRVVNVDEITGDVTLGMVNALSEKMPMNSTAKAEMTYADTELCNYLDTTFYNLLPSDVKSVLKPQTKTFYTSKLKTSANPQYYARNLSKTKTVKVWIPSFNNIYGESSYHPQEDDGHNTGESQFQFYNKGTAMPGNVWISNQNGIFSDGNRFMYFVQKTRQLNSVETGLYGVWPHIVVGR